MRGLAARARELLEERIAALMAFEQARYSALVDGLELDPGAAEALRQAVRRVDDLRFADAQKSTGHDH